MYYIILYYIILFDMILYYIILYILKLVEKSCTFWIVYIYMYQFYNIYIYVKGNSVTTHEQHVSCK